MSIPRVKPLAPVPVIELPRKQNDLPVPRFDPEHATVVTFHCSDGRFTQHIEALMHSIGIPKYDILSMPGGPALLDMSSATILEAEAARTGMSFLVRSHSIEQVYLIAHIGCGFYRKRYAGQPASVIETKQVRDLQTAAAWLRKAHPTVKTFIYFAVPNADEVRFKRIEVDDKAELLLL
jgi:hypothetical protein